MQNLYIHKVIQQLIAALLISILSGWVVVRALSSTSSMAIFGSAAILLFIAFILVLFTKSLLKRLGLKNLILYAFIASSFIGPGLLSLKIGPISLFPYRVLLPVALALFLLNWARSKNLSIFGREPVKPVLVFLFSWIIFALISLLWVQSLVEGVKDIFFLVSGIFFIFLFVFLFNKRKEYTSLLYLWIFVMIFMLMIGFWNYLTHQQLPVSRLYYMGAYVKHRPTAVFANENDYASYLALSFFFAFAVFLRFEPGKWQLKTILIRLVAGILMLSTIFQIYTSESRANLLALFVGLVFWFLLYTGKREKRIVILAGFAVFIPGIILFSSEILAAFNQIWQQVSSTFRPSYNEEASTDIRINLLKNALIFIAGSIGLGIGAGNIEYYMKHYAELPTAGIVNIHNWWAEIFVHYGIFIFIGYLFLYLWLMVSLYRLHRQSWNWKDRMITQALGTSLAAFFLASMSPSSFMTLNYSWILIAFAIGYINFRLKNKEEQKELSTNE
ncbi:O-antigen ligase family protein [Bacillus sp. REN3]|uniref:O-antigen ligase family protein n=1 Tax=Bacillus sp. REN3 TaxID=2802440 RepID=UPI001AEE1114|nr:O-antigen ligase family protein [Bacillus sp. REN3]